MRFASLLVYTPWRRDPENLGPGPRSIMGMVKGARPEVLERIAVRCGERRDTDFDGFFTPDSTLVPVPTSAPARVPDTLWPGLSIAEALLEQGLGRDVQKLLVRTVRVPRAHEQSAADRPRMDELVASLEWRGDFGSGLEQIVLVDDVVTRGTTFSCGTGSHPPHRAVAGSARVRRCSNDELRGCDRTPEPRDRPGGTASEWVGAPRSLSAGLAQSC